MNAQVSKSRYELTPDRLRLHGDLTLSSVTKLYRDSLSLAKHPQLPKLIDLTEVNRVDSAGLALLLEWQSWAVQRQHYFCYSNVPDKLLKLASLCGATEVLNMVRCAGIDPNGDNFEK